MMVALVSMLTVPAFGQDSKWLVNGRISIFGKYLTDGGFAPSPNPSFQPELLILHKPTGLEVYFWDSVDLKTGRVTEADYYIRYNFILPAEIKAKIGVGYFQLDRVSDQFEGLFRIERTFATPLGDFSPFIKQELPLELSSGRIASWSYIGVIYSAKLFDRLFLILQPQYVVYNSFNRELSSNFALDAVLMFQVDKNFSFGPQFKFREPTSLPFGDCRKTETTVGGFFNYFFD